MSLATIIIEQIEHQRWVAEIEAGFPICRMARLRAENFDDLMTQIRETYRGFVPEDEAGPPPMGEQEIDASALPPRGPRPVGKRRAAELRHAADNG